MASIYRRLWIDASPPDVWEALADIGALHQRLVPGFVTSTELEPGARIVTFADGAVVRELIVGLDQENRRLAWSAAGGVSTHHNASAQVVDGENGGTDFTWITDVLPDEMAEPIGRRMDQGLAVIKKTMEARSARGRSQ
jgi:Polyketide cyclase / dehydrase and lipid transport